MSTLIPLQLDEELAQREKLPQARMVVRPFRTYVQARKECHVALKEAIQQINESRFISAESIHDWIRSWNTEDETPPPSAGSRSESLTPNPDAHIPLLDWLLNVYQRNNMRL